MTAAAVLAISTRSQVVRSKLRDYCTLTKPEVNLLILMTTSTGYILASHGPLKVAGLINTLVGTLLVASGTATLNQWMERVCDARMRRTASRPIPSGRMRARQAFLFGIVLSITGSIYLNFAVNHLSALLAISTLLSYLLIYTPLKRVTPFCTLLGAIPGAMPTLIGWAGATDAIAGQAWFLFAILFLWQFPHFLAIALMYRNDYARAGFHMLPSFDRDSRFTMAEILGFTAALVLTTMSPLAERSGPLYFTAMALAGTFLLYYVIRLIKSGSTALASRVLHATVVYLPVALGVMIASKP